jgi:phospholipid/cholesterol/gamma-HCH transport system substrate-binding protein
MQTRTIEIIVGCFILAGIIALSILAFQISGLSNIVGRHGYIISAPFDNVGDLRVRAPVSIGGVRIGEVTNIKLDKNTFRAVVSMQIVPDQNTIPTDSTASILTEGLLGSNYISITPGFADTNLKNGDTLQATHSAIILENLIGQLMYKLSPNSDSNKSS